MISRKSFVVHRMLSLSRFMPQPKRKTKELRDRIVAPDPGIKPHLVSVSQFPFTSENARSIPTSSNDDADILFEVKQVVLRPVPHGRNHEWMPTSRHFQRRNSPKFEFELRTIKS